MEKETKLQQLQDDSNFFGAFLVNDPDELLRRSISKHYQNGDEYDFLYAYLSAVRALVDGKAVPYSFEIGTAFDYTDAVIRYACSYIINLEGMIDDIDEYCNWLLKNDVVMDALNNPPENKKTLLRDYLQSEWNRVKSAKETCDTVKPGEVIDVIQYVSDPARGYNREYLEKLDSYACAGEPKYNKRVRITYEEWLSRQNLGTGRGDV